MIDANVILRLTGIKKRYKNEIVLENINLVIRSGRIYGIIGPNGSGKTTLLTLITSIKKCVGTIEKRNDIRVGSLIEKPEFYDHLTAIQNLTLVAHLKAVGTSEIESLLDLVGLSNQKNKKYRHFSLGMKQRLGIAAAIVGNPDLIIFDEPTNGLDPLGIIDLRNLFVQLNQQGKTIIITSHLLSEIEKVCTDIIVLHNGQLLYNDTMQEFLKNHEDSETALLKVLKS